MGKDKYYKLEKYKGRPKYAKPIQGVSKARPWLKEYKKHLDTHPLTLEIKGVVESDQHLMSCIDAYVLHECWSTVSVSRTVKLRLDEI